MKTRKEIKLIITDFDGVILKSENAKNEAFEECFSIFPAPIFKEFIEYHRNNITIGRYAKFEFFYDKILKIGYSEENEKFISERFNNIVFNKVVLSPFLPGVKEFIINYSKCIPIIIISGTPKEELIKILDYLKISRYFINIFSIPPIKSDIVAKVLKLYKLKSENVVYLGDMNNDLLAAQKNKVPFIGVRGTEDFMDKKICEINDFLTIDNILYIYNDKVYLNS